jgi:8-hydroxy-5-deazaflavin:NADPH oxidoreductase
MYSEKPILAVLGGTGKEGRALAARFANAGYRVVIGSRDAERALSCAASIAEEFSVESVSGDSLKDAAAAAEIVILTVPRSGQISTLELVREELQGKILVDVTVPLAPPRVTRVQLPESGSAVVEAQQLLREATRVVSAFQNISHDRLDKIGEPVGCDVLVCGDDKDAREQVVNLAKSIGMNAFHAGSLANSAAAEALTSVLIFMNGFYKAHGAGIQIVGVD